MTTMVDYKSLIIPALAIANVSASGWREPYWRDRGSCCWMNPSPPTIVLIVSR